MNTLKEPAPQTSTTPQKSEESLAHFLLMTSRPGFWSTTLWFSLLPFAGRNVFDRWPIWVGLLYFAFPFGMLLYGWNDLGDRDTDRHNPRKGNLLFGAKGNERQLARLPLAIVVSQVPFLIVFGYLLGWRIVPWYAALLLANALYNAPSLHFKGRPPLDLLNQVGYLLVFPLASWLGDVPQLPWQTWVFSALFAMCCHLFGQILDLDSDAASGRRTSATVLGPLPAKYVLAGFFVVVSVFTGVYFHNVFLTGVFVCAALGFWVDARYLFRAHPYPQALVRLSGYALNLAALGSMYPVWASQCLLPAP